MKEVIGRDERVHHYLYPNPYSEWGLNQTWVGLTGRCQDKPKTDTG